MPKEPESTELKLVKGVRPGRINQREPWPKSSISKPTWLNGRAAGIWKKYAPELHRIGVLKYTDCPMFAVWCSLMGQFSEDPRSFGAARLSQLRGLAKSFGLTPGGRRGIRAEPPQKPDPGEDYFT